MVVLEWRDVLVHKPTEKLPRSATRVSRKIPGREISLEAAKRDRATYKKHQNEELLSCPVTCCAALAAY